jgi:hypothetical protein
MVPTLPVTPDLGKRKLAKGRGGGDGHGKKASLLMEVCNDFEGNLGAITTHTFPAHSTLNPENCSALIPSVSGVSEIIGVDKTTEVQRAGWRNVWGLAMKRSQRVTTPATMSFPSFYYHHHHHYHHHSALTLQR